MSNTSRGARLHAGGFSAHLVHVPRLKRQRRVPGTQTPARSPVFVLPRPPHPSLPNGVMSQRWLRASQLARAVFSSGVNAVESTSSSAKVTFGSALTTLASPLRQHSGAFAAPVRTSLLVHPRFTLPRPLLSLFNASYSCTSTSALPPPWKSCISSRPRSPPFCPQFALRSFASNAAPVVSDSEAKVRAVKLGIPRPSCFIRPSQ